MSSKEQPKASGIKGEASVSKSSVPSGTNEPPSVSRSNAVEPCAISWSNVDKVDKRVTGIEGRFLPTISKPSVLQAVPALNVFGRNEKPITVKAGVQVRKPIGTMSHRGLLMQMKPMTVKKPEDSVQSKIDPIDREELLNASMSAIDQTALGMEGVSYYKFPRQDTLDMQIFIKKKELNFVLNRFH